MHPARAVVFWCDSVGLLLTDFRLDYFTSPSAQCSEVLFRILVKWALILPATLVPTNPNGSRNCFKSLSLEENR